LVSVVAPLELGDALTVSSAAAGEFRLTCTDPELSCDESNLVLKAARAFAATTGWKGGAAFHLEKRVPVGAGLGGGSSDAVAALRGLNALAGNPLDRAALERVAATLGSDCPLFLRGAPVVMRGRGERVEDLPASAAKRISGRRVLVFKPTFGIATAWAYRRMAEMAVGDGGVYFPETEAERSVQQWFDDPTAPLDALLFNNLERPAFEKFVALPTLLDQLRAGFGLRPVMSGSGSACFALLPDTFNAAPVIAQIRGAWGDSAFVVDTRFA
jgi:4-diphosphocytidyl-2-C-methyl-D-erythritol kinase